jgi:tetratricopeptide (TPR) repeat protein
MISSDAEVAVATAEALLAEGRGEAAVALLRPFAGAEGADHPVLATCATALKAVGRPLDALPFNEMATRRYAGSAVAWHNLAATLGDLGRGEASLAAIERAFDLGLDGPASWSVRARAALAAGQLELAERSYMEALRRGPGAVETAVELANLNWMRGAELAQAQLILDACFHGGGDPSALLQAKARLLQAGGEAQAAAQLLQAAVVRIPGDVGLVLSAVQAELEAGGLAAAETLMTTAVRLAPGRIEVLNQLAILELALGRPERALDAASQGLREIPENQSLLAWQATAARQLGDPLYQQLYDYDRMVAAYDIEAPPGWPSLEAYVTDLAQVLRPMHSFARHPFHQSVRHGSQTLQGLLGSEAPALMAFFKAIEASLYSYMARLGQGDDPLRRRNRGGYLVEAAWSVLLGAGGFHLDHFHPRGWISSAFYVETPDGALAGADQAGWLRFGQPPLALHPTLTAEHHVRPRPGRLVLFPSYMWHGTNPFATHEQRLSLAFDVTPAAAMA